ncbi:MAG: hypothetical protein GXP33_03035 [Spirochaetes bacterium]|nr:hypothetical protein [Spirochaetota bacterium]
MEDNSGRDNHSHKHHKKSAEASLISGLVFTVAFGIVWFSTKQWFWVFPVMFAGVLPAAKGLQRLIRNRWGNSSQGRNAEAIAEKEILKLARRENGIVTPAMAAIDTELTVEKAEKILDKLAGKGYASMRVTDDGMIKYEFPEFMRRIDN